MRDHVGPHSTTQVGDVTEALSSESVASPSTASASDARADVTTAPVHQRHVPTGEVESHGTEPVRADTKAVRTDHSRSKEPRRKHALASVGGETTELSMLTQVALAVAAGNAFTLLTCAIV